MAPFHIPSSGPASTYPSTIVVGDLVGSVTRVDVWISITHVDSSDVDIMLVGPAGQNLIVMSDVGDGGNNASFTITDFAPGLMNPFAANHSGSYTPTNYVAGDPFAAPAPAPSAATTMATFNGTNPNGEWKLFVVDDEFGFNGMVNGWALSINTAGPSLYQGSMATRLLDTRPLQPQGARFVTKSKIPGDTAIRVTPIGVAGVPFTNVGAVSMNVTVNQPDGDGFVSVYPCGTIPPTSSVNFRAGQTVANTVITPVTAGGEFCVYAARPTHVIIDVMGWFP